jgi:trimethylamine--corrinoid protein Co-methyltransferase
MAGATVTIHAAGWLEGGLTVSYEKMICDIEVLNMVAELCAGAQAGPSEIGYDALRAVQPSGHFFDANQTMERYATEFYEPVVHDYANFGTWTERGKQGASERATAVWQKIVADDPQVAFDPNALDKMQQFIAKRSAEGGAPPES